MAGEASPFEKILVLDALPELVLSEEVVVAAFLFGGTAGPRGGRDGDNEVGKQREYFVDEGAFARAGGTGDDDESGDDRSSMSKRVLRGEGQLLSISSSSLRWRGVRPFTVLDELTRHRSSNLLALTRPYLGTARTRSSTLAVATHAGGSARTSLMETSPLRNASLSRARSERISFALRSASIRCCWLRSGVCGTMLMGWLTGAIIHTRFPDAIRFIADSTEGARPP